VFLLISCKIAGIDDACFRVRKCSKVRTRRERGNILGARPGLNESRRDRRRDDSFSMEDAQSDHGED